MTFLRLAVLLVLAVAGTVLSLRVVDGSIGRDLSFVQAVDGFSSGEQGTGPVNNDLLRFDPILSPDGPSANFRIILRDSLTGRYLSGQVSAADGKGLVGLTQTDSAGRGRFSVETGRFDLGISASGYDGLRTHFEFDQRGLDVNAWLDPIEPTVEMRPDVIASKIVAGKILLRGHLYDETGQAVKNARVYLEDGNAEAVSDEHGYFSMSAPVPPADPVGDMPAASNLAVEVGGKVVYRRTNILLAEGATHLIIDIDRQAGITVKDDTHKLKLSLNELKNTQYERPETESAAERARAVSALRPASVAVPSSIRVGSSCPSKLTCTVFNVYTLDTYTRLGLDDEWISSWNTNSLKAGAIAFRSYGVYHVYHPLTANYDICNTTSCQVMDPTDSATSVDTATAQTTGSIVVDSTGANPFFAEYAAENNANLCPDGMTGNNGSWPCMNDLVDAGQTFNGHGRGMCQWGTQRWSVNQGKDFVWIVDHYYNNNGNPSGLRTGLLQTSPSSVLPPPALAAPGVSNLAPGSTIATMTPTFQWQQVAGADGFGLYISKFNGTTYDVIFNSEIAIGQPLPGTSFTLPDGLLQISAQYRWNMSAHNTAGYGSANTFRNYFAVRAPVTVSGRVFTAAGLGLKNAAVTLQDGLGATRRVMTSSFGSYTFDAVTPGQTYTITVSSKRYRFTPLSVQVTNDLANIDFTGLE